MAVSVIMPKQGLQMTEGLILTWHKKEGDTVVSGEPLFEIETDKLTIEIDASASGTLLKILKQEGDVVPVAETIAVIGEAGEDITTLLKTKSDAESALGSEEGWQDSDSSTDVVDASKAVATPVSVGERVFITPRAKGLAKSKALTLSELEGSGPEGMVIERDVLAYLSQKSKSTPLARRQASQSGVSLDEIQGTGPRGKIYSRDMADSPSSMASSTEHRAEGVVLPLSPMRKIIARRMRESLDVAAQAVHRITVDMSEITQVRNKHKEIGSPVSFNDLIIKAVALTLKKHPVLNSQFTQDGIMEMEQVNIGVAVAVPNGLLVPILKNADLKSLAKINAETKKLSEAARHGKLQTEDLEGGTFTVSNLGMYGLDSFTAIINQPESGILAVGAVKEAAVVIAGQIVVRPICELSLTYDHRVVDGAPAAEFIKDLKNVLENPYLMI